MMELTLILGSNLGDRRKNLSVARAELTAVFGDPLRFSEVIETAAVGFDGPAFLNQALVFECSLPPVDVLRLVKKIEAYMGRTDHPEFDSEGRRIYHSRIIDIDILTYGDIVLDTPELKIPHPQLQERDYAKVLYGNLKTRF